MLSSCRAAEALLVMLIHHLWSTNALLCPLLLSSHLLFPPLLFLSPLLLPPLLSSLFISSPLSSFPTSHLSSLLLSSPFPSSIPHLCSSLPSILFFSLWAPHMKLNYFFSLLLFLRGIVSRGRHAHRQPHVYTDAMDGRLVMPF